MGRMGQSSGIIVILLGAGLMFMFTASATTPGNHATAAATELPNSPAPANSALSAVIAISDDFCNPVRPCCRVADVQPPTAVTATQDDCCHPKGKPCCRIG
ncbi:hypothetical protein CRG98_014499 [Punica granatum]|uniref:Uncharacterized protein n=1 Tax=Punica granatum TaxID=22663 RepID=A0A2I0KA34_PUNGR|nr:hypothetical protein CRG98_014499 [Punica granatum]